MRARVNSQRGFTLIELMIVIILIGIFTGLMVGEMRGTFEDALLRSTARKLIATANLADAGVGDRTEIRLGPASESLRAMPEEPVFDLAFIDADKTGYPEYYELVLPRVRTGGLILLDNMLRSGRVTEPESDADRVIDELNRRIHADERVDLALVLVADGLTFARKR